MPLWGALKKLPFENFIYFSKVLGYFLQKVLKNGLVLKFKKIKDAPKDELITHCIALLRRRASHLLPHPSCLIADNDFESG